MENIMKQRMEEINKSVDQLKVLQAEQDFIRNSNVLDYDSYTLILEDGMYVIYHDNEAIATYASFGEAYNFINKVTNE